RKMAVGDLSGFDVKPAEDAVVAAMQSPALSEASQLAGVRIIGRLSGRKAQQQLIEIALSDKRPVPLRVAAADELRKHLQEYGLPEVAQQREMLEAVQAALKQPT